MAAAGSLLLHAQTMFGADATWVTMTMACLAILVAILLFFGFMTPMAGVLATVAAFVSEPCSVYVLCISTAIVLLGPGAFSVDARLFGRREIVIADLRRDPSSPG
jgi:fumarate reductase subunit D